MIHSIMIMKRLLSKSACLSALCLAILLTVSCSRDPHFITDHAYRNEVHNDFEARLAEFPMLQVSMLLKAKRNASSSVRISHLL